MKRKENLEKILVIFSFFLYIFYMDTSFQKNYKIWGDPDLKKVNRTSLDISDIFHNLEKQPLYRI